MRFVFSNLHLILGYSVFIYVISQIFLDKSFRSIPSGESSFQKTNERNYKIHRLMIWILVVSILTGGYLGTPFFKAMSFWIFAKLGLYIALMGIMSALISKAFKVRRSIYMHNAISAQASHLELVGKANKLMSLGIVLELVIISLIFILAYTKVHSF